MSVAQQPSGILEIFSAGDRYVDTRRPNEGGDFASTCIIVIIIAIVVVVVLVRSASKEGRGSRAGKAARFTISRHVIGRQVSY